LLLFAQKKRLAHDIIVQPVMVMPLTFVSSITTPAWPMLMRPLRFVALSKLVIWY
jgi:hypothetical protein